MHKGPKAMRKESDTGGEDYEGGGDEGRKDGRRQNVVFSTCICWSILCEHLEFNDLTTAL